MTGIMLATGLAVAACGPARSSTAAGAGAGNPTAQASAAGSSAGASVPSASSSGVSEPATSASAVSVFAEAKSEWVLAASKPLAVVGQYYASAASDLKQGVTEHPGYQQAISDLTYLAGLPDSDASATQIATSRADTKYLNSFFGTAAGG